MSLLCAVECSCLGVVDVLGVRASAVAGELLVSMGGGQIQVLNMEHGVCVKSWQLSSAQILSSPVVQHPTSRDYWAIINNTDLLSWQFTDTSLTQSPQGLPSLVHCLLVTRSNKAPLAVLSNGSVCVATEMVKAPKNKAIKVVFAHVLTCGDKVCVVCSCEAVLRVDVWAVDREGVTLVTTAPLDKDSLSSFCISKNKLLAADMEGEVYSWTVGTGEVEPSRSLSLSKRPIRLQINTLANYFVTNDGKKLSLWEPVYMTKQAELKVHGITTVHSCGEWVCGVGDGGVRVWRVVCVDSGLSGALDKATSQQPITVATWDREVVSDGGVLDKLADKEKTPTLKHFMDVFSSCPLTSDLCYSHVVERLLEERVFWARGALDTLIRAGAVPSSLSDAVLREVVSHVDWELLCVCVEEMTGFSETVLVDVMDQIISTPCSTQLTQDLRHTILSLLLCQPFNDALLQQPLSQLSPSTVRDLLGFVSSQLTLPSLLTQRPLTYNALLDWAAQILDVHFTQLTFDPTSRDLLVALQARVMDQVVCWGRLSCVRGAVDALSVLAKAPTTNGWLYKLETMDIDL